MDTPRSGKARRARRRRWPLPLSVAWLPALTIALPGFGYAQGVTTYDGAYNGVSNTASGADRDCYPAFPVPRPLTIKNGDIAWAAGLDGTVVYHGSVTAEGAIRAKATDGHIFMGKIAAGKITGGVTGFNCVFWSTWQKQ